MHTLNGGSCQQTTSSSNGGATGDGNCSNSDVETLHPLNTNSNNHHHHSSTLNYNNLKNSLNNGHQSHNSVAACNGQPTPSFTPGQRDILRLIGQHLRYLGLSKTTDSLISESGCMLEHPTATNFCNLVMNGEWDKAERSLNDLKGLMDLNTDITKMRFLILEQKYLECLEDGKILEALKCLRDELAPLKYNTDRLHELSGFLMCAGTDDLKRLSNWDGKTDASRQKLMDKLQAFLPANIMLPPRRLENLLTQAIELQCERCPYHNTKDKASLDTWSLFKDHVCTKDQFPTTNIQILTDHCDEIWYCKFSNNGTKLATGSKDGSLIIWDVNPNTLKVSVNKTYDEHTCGVGYVEWSPDDHYIIVCGTEECNELWIWDMEQKVLKKRLNHSHDDSIITTAWLPDGQHFVCGGLKGQFYYCDIEGNVKDTWEGVRVRSLQCLPDGVILAADSLKRIRRYNFRDISDSNLIQEDFQIMSFTLNKQCNLALISVSTQGIHLWDLKDRTLVRRYQGALQNHYLGWATFGGINESFVASGSEDNKVFIWHAKKEQPICILEGHTRSVNCVSWNPVLHGQVASVSDDGTVRIWAPSQYATDAPATSNNNSALVQNNLTNDNNNNNIAMNTTGVSTLNNSDNNTATANRSDRSTPV